MAGVDPQELQDLAEEFLDACIEALDTIPVFVPGSVGSPARTFVSPGKPAYDCCDDGQLTVHVQSIQERFGSQKDVRINDVTMIATALRCIPMREQGEPPEPAVMAASADQINMDRWALWNHVYNMYKECGLFDKCCGVRWGTLQSVDAQGMCGGSTMTVTACLAGYDEVCST